MLTNQEIKAELERIDRLPIDEADKAEMREVRFAKWEKESELEKSEKASTYMGGDRVTYETGPNPDSFKWFDPFKNSFVPTFRSADELNREYTLGYGEIKGLKIRKLGTGDYMFLASLTPRAVSHLKDDKSIFDPVTGEPNVLPLIMGVVRKALEDWDTETHSPTGFASEVLGAIVLMFRYKEPRTGQLHEPGFTVNDLLDSDPEEVVNLVVAMYRGNVAFFLKICNSSSVIRGGMQILGSIFTNIKNSLKGLAELSTQTDQATTTKTTEENVQSGSGGRKRGGKMNSLASIGEAKAS